MVQTKKMGSTISCLWPRLEDHAGVPVMLPHKSDSKVRRDGSKAARMQLLHPVDERGRLHGVPDLRLRRLPMSAWRSVPFTVRSRETPTTNIDINRPRIKTALQIGSR